MGRKKKEAGESASYNPQEDQPCCLTELVQWLALRKRSASLTGDRPPVALEESRPGMAKVLGECRHLNAGVVSVEALEKMAREFAKAKGLAYLEAMNLDLEEVAAGL